MVLGQLAAGRGIDKILGDYPNIEWADVLGVLKYAASAVNERARGADRASRMKLLVDANLRPGRGYAWPMPVAPEVLLEQALALSPEDRARLASGLLASLDDAGADEAEVERLWSEETERRASQIASGAVGLTTWDQVIEHVGGHRPSTP